MSSGNLPLALLRWIGRLPGHANTLLLAPESISADVFFSPVEAWHSSRAMRTPGLTARNGETKRGAMFPCGETMTCVAADRAHQTVREMKKRSPIPDKGRRFFVQVLRTIVQLFNLFRRRCACYDIVTTMGRCACSLARVSRQSRVNSI
jgi:hypothetical protein